MLRFEKHVMGPIFVARDGQESRLMHPRCSKRSVTIAAGQGCGCEGGDDWPSGLCSCMALPGPRLVSRSSCSWRREPIDELPGILGRAKLATLTLLINTSSSTRIAIARICRQSQQPPHTPRASTIAEAGRVAEPCEP
jgi:hypothetical protein